MNLESLARAHQADPTDEDLAARLVIERARVEGAGVFLESLRDRADWNKSGESVQDLAIKEAARRLAPKGIELDRVSVWSCANPDRDCPDDSEVYSINGGHALDLCAACSALHRAGEPFPVITHRLATFCHRATGMELQLIPGRKAITCRDLLDSLDPGSIPRGATITTQSQPVINPLLIGRWPVTRGQWLAHSENRGAGLHRIDGFRPSLAPLSSDIALENVHQKAAAIWTEETALRLPTANEWEHACRAGTDTRFYWGDEFDSDHVWCAGNSNSHGEGPGVSGFYHAAGCCMPRAHSPQEHDDAKKWNAFGLVDMIGNVMEWCQNERLATGCYASYERNFDEERIAIAIGDIQDYRGFRAACDIPGLE